MMDTMNRSYLLSTSKSPHKIKPHLSFSTPKVTPNFDIRKAMEKDTLIRKDSTITEVESTGSAK